MHFPQKYGFLFTCFILCMVDSRGIAGNVKLVAMNGNQYWFSSSSPYAPHLNFHLAYQYCRTLGLQLVVLEAKEEVETISAYLNSGDGSSLNINKYWTSGNKLGADSWIWMSSGEQLNSSFSDYWLKSGNGSPTDNPKHCMSMKAPITKRAIFTSEECNKSLPFICEQVRCLYYNYPVSLFPDPSELRTDIEEGTVATPTEAESRSSPTFSNNDKIRAQNFISGRTISNPTLSDFAAQESGRIDPSKIQRRITLRPVMSAYPYPPRYINSFYKYKSVDYELTSTSRPAFKKTTIESLWSPSSSESNTNFGPTSSTIATSGSVAATVNKIADKSKDSGELNRKTTFVTAKVLRPSNSTVSTTIETSVRADQDLPKTYTHLEIVTSRSTSIDGEEVTEFDDNDNEGETTIYTRYGAGNGEYVSTNPTVVFDDEANNVGGEVPDEDTEKPDIKGVSSKFFHGNGIRRPDTKLKSSEIGVTGRTKSSEERVSGDREASQTHSPATMKTYPFQRNKTPINWPRNGNRSVTSIIASTNVGPSKIGLGPRLQFRNRN